MRTKDLLFAAAIAWLCVARGSSVQPPHDESKGSRHPAGAADRDEQQRAAVAKEADHDRREAEETEHRRREVWYWIIYTLATIGGAAGAAVAAFYASLAFSSAERQAKASERATIATTRAWLDLDVVVDGPLTWEAGSPTLRIEITTKNSGPSPAQRVRFAPSLFVRDNRHSNLAAELTSRCEGYRRLGSYAYPIGVSVFPGRESREQTSSNVPASEVDSAIEGFRIGGPLIPPDLMPTLALVVCVDYLVAGDVSTHHQTGAAYDLMRLSRSEPRRTLYVPHLVDVPKEDLRLMHNFQGDYAD